MTTTMSNNSADNILMKLELSNLKHEKEKLLLENDLLKQQLAQMAMEFVIPDDNKNVKRKYTMTDETRAKWEYYHQHKKRVLETLFKKSLVQEPPKWYDIKRITDNEMKK
jgi:hypothetical protein